MVTTETASMPGRRPETMTKRNVALTRTMLNYLEVIREQEWLTKGWGGYGSTQTVRILEERGLISLREVGKGWQAKIRPAGREALRAAGRVAP
jgi:hypothetical protein